MSNHVFCYNLQNSSHIKKHSLFQAIPAYSWYSRIFKLIKAITAYTSLAQPIHEYARLFQPTPFNSSQFLPIPAYSSPYQPIPEKFQHIPACTCQIQPNPASSSLLQHILSYSRLFQEDSIYFQRAFKCFQTMTNNTMDKLHTDTQNNKHACRGLTSESA